MVPALFLIMADYEFFDLKPDTGSVLQEVLDGLAAPQKRISPKYFYDEAGSALFEEITRLPEYYPTRTEMALFDTHARAISDQLGQGGALVEYGSGSSLKIRKLLETVRPQAYVPVDISGDHLQANARALQADFPWLSLYPVCADFTQAFALPPTVQGLARTGFFPGSSIGNATPTGAQALLRTIAQTLGPGSHLLIGVDRKKDAQVLQAAYDDAAGVTAAFNLNMLAHLNRELDADFALDGFVHEAHYNETLGCVQMFLRSTRSQTVRVAGHAFTFAEGERVHTEDSYKYHPQEFEALAAVAGYERTGFWTDATDYYSVFLLRC